MMGYTHATRGTFQFPVEGSHKKTIFLAFSGNTFLIYMQAFSTQALILCIMCTHLSTGKRLRTVYGRITVTFAFFRALVKVFLLVYIHNFATKRIIYLDRLCTNI